MSWQPEVFGVSTETRAATAGKYLVASSQKKTKALKNSVDTGLNKSRGEANTMVTHSGHAEN